MANEAQAQADSQTESTVVDPLDAANSQDGTINALDDFSREVQDALSQPTNHEQGHGAEPATQFEEPVMPREKSQNLGDEPEQEQISEEQEQPDPEASEEEEQQEETKVPDRFRFKDNEDKAVAALAKAEGISLIEAAARYSALKNPTKRGEDQADQQQDKADTPTETVDSVKAEIKELEAKAREAQTSLNFDEAEDFRQQANELRDKLIDLKLAEREAAKQAESKQEQEFYAAFQASEEKAIQYYPDAGRPDSQLAKEMLALDAQMKDLGDPLYFSDNKPFILAQQAAVKLGIPMTKPGAAPKPKASVQHRPMQPASGNARTTTTDTAKRISEEIDGISSMADFERAVASMSR